MKKLALFLILVALVLVLWDILAHKDYIDAFSGATPPALERDVPDGLSLKVDGRVKQEYQFTSNGLRLLAKVRIRTRENTRDKEMLGAYIYTGVPVLYMLEGVVPVKTERDAFDRPLDMMVVFTSATGQTASFSYGELTCTTDSLPVTLAYHREPLLPTKDPGEYKGNKYKEALKGLRLICPREPDTWRYLDNVVRMTLVIPGTPDEILPRQQKKSDCTSTSITCLENKGSERPAVYDGIPLVEIRHWFRIGHGRGIKGDRPSVVSGYRLRSFLKGNFPGCGDEDFFIFIGCDGYRVLFSGREIFLTGEGEQLILVQTLDGQGVGGEYTLGPVSDFFVDRAVKGVSHIVRLHGLEEKKGNDL